MSHERIEDAPSNGRLRLEYIHVLFPNCEVTNIAALLEVLHLCVGCQVNEEIMMDCPFLNALHQPENKERPDAVHGGIRLILAQGMEDQLLHIFPRIQTGFHRQLRQKLNDVSLYQWGWGTKIVNASDVEADVLLDKTSRHLEIRCCGPKNLRAELFAFQDDLCDIVVQILGECCPGMYTQWSPLSPLQVKDNLKTPHAYTPRDILLAQRGSKTTIQLDENISEQLSDVIAYGSPEVYACMSPGFDLHVSSLSLYARYQLASHLDPTHPLGYDWCMLAISLGLSDVLPRLDVKEAAPLSKTDGILSLWSRNPESTIRALYDKLLKLERNDVVDTLLSLAPLYHYSPPSNGTAAITKSQIGSHLTDQHSQSPAQYAHAKEGTRQTLSPDSPHNKTAEAVPEDIGLSVSGNNHSNLLPTPTTAESDNSSQESTANVDVTDNSRNTADHNITETTQDHSVV